MTELREKENKGIREPHQIPRTDRKQPFIIPFKWMPSVYRNMFNFAGRTGRIQGIVDMLVIGITVALYAIIISLIGITKEEMQPLNYILIIVVGIAFLAMAARRLRDAGYPATDVWVLLIPIIGIPWAIWKLTRESDYDSYQKTNVWYKKYAEDYYVDKE